jgi:hypothetical protein
LVDAEVRYHLRPKAIRDALAKYFKLTPNWDAKYNKQFMEWAVECEMTAEQVRCASIRWQEDSVFNWRAADLRLIQEHWYKLIETQQAPLNLVY